MMVGSDPQSYKKACHDPRWQAAMDEEYESLQNNETWDLVSLPPERRDKSTFLHGDLEEEIYMKHPKGMACQDRFFLIVTEIRKVQV